MTTMIERKINEPQRVAYIAYKGPVAEANKIMKEVFQAIEGKANGSPFCLIHQIDEKTQIAQLDLCVPTEEEPTRPGVFVKVLPADKVVSLFHIGSYQELPQAYQQLRDFIDSRDLQPNGPVREIYHRGPGQFFKGNPNKYMTEVQIAVYERDS